MKGKAKRKQTAKHLSTNKKSTVSEITFQLSFRIYYAIFFLSSFIQILIFNDVALKYIYRAEQKTKQKKLK